jgi:hypothetical protein
MQKRNIVVLLSSILFLLVLFPLSADAATVTRPILKQGMKNPYVKALQIDLKSLGFFTTTPTEYFSRITKSSVMKFQAKYHLSADGEVGPQTYNIIDKLLVKNKSISSRSGEINREILVPWFNDAENIFYIGAIAKVVDIDTGLSFNVKRTYGYNHADCETLTSDDTTIMKKIFGGQWNWERRAIIVIVNGRKMAASMAGMPHAGREDLPGDIWVNDWRTEGYGPGYNLDKIKGNDMAGHFDIHFLGSKTHGTNKVDDAHQAMIMKAAKSGF